MAGMSLTMLLRLLPIKTGPEMRKALDGIGVSIDRALEFLREVQTESRPGAATETIDLWLQALGLSMPSDATLGDKRAAAESAYTQIGNQSVGYIRDRINARFPDVTITETSTTTYTMAGFYPYSRDFVYLLALLQRITPAHLEAVFNVRPVYDGDVARCNWGIVGRAICGRGATAYRPTEGTIARCGVGRVGLARVGREAVI